MADWEAALSADGTEIYTLLRNLSPILAHAALRPFLEAYLVAAHVLATDEWQNPIDGKLFARQCESVGRQFLLQRRIASEDSLNPHYFGTFTELANHRGLFDAGCERDVLVAELEQLCGRVDHLKGIADSSRRFTLGNGRSRTDAP